MEKEKKLGVETMVRRFIVAFLVILGVLVFDKDVDSLWVNWTDGNYVNALLDDGNYLYVGSSGGLWIIDETANSPLGEKFISSDGLGSTEVTVIKKLPTGKRLYGTYLGVTYHDDNGTIMDKSDDKYVTFGAGDGIPTYTFFGVPMNPVWDILVRSSSVRWYATEKGVVYHHDYNTPFNKGDDIIKVFDKTTMKSTYESVNSIAGGTYFNWYGTRNYTDKDMLRGAGSVIYHYYGTNPADPSDDTFVEFLNWSYEMDDSIDYSWDSSADPGNGMLLLGPGTDDSSASIAFPADFSFYLYDIKLSGVYVDSNGRVSPYAGSYYNNYSFPCNLTGCKIVIAPLWNDLIVRNDGQTRGIYYRFISTRTKKLVITFWNVEHYPQNYTSTFQVILYSDSNKIQFNYRGYNAKPNDPDTFGLNFGDNQRYNSPSSIASQKSILFTPIDFSSVESIVIDSSGKNWYATAHEGIIYHDTNGTPTDKTDDTMVRWTPDELAGSYMTLPGPFYQIVIDSNNKKWYASAYSVYEGGSWKHGGVIYHDDNGTPTNKSDDTIVRFNDTKEGVNRIAIDAQDGRIKWYGTRGEGVDKHNTGNDPSNPSDDTWNYIKDTYGKNISGVKGIARRSSSERWLVTDKGIIYHNDGGTPASKSDDTWVSYTSTQHSTLSSPEGGILIDSNGKNWYGTSQGVTYHDTNGTPLIYTDDKYNDFRDVDYLMELTTSAGWNSYADPGYGTELNFSSCDDATATINLSTPLKFYDVEFNKIVVDTNGRISFVGVTSDYSNPQFPCTENPNCQFVIAPFWDDLSLCVYGTNTARDPNRKILYYSSSYGTFVVITFWNIRHYNSPDGNTFQIVLYDSSILPITFNYKNINDISDETIGINRGDGGRFNKFTGTIYDNYGFEFKLLKMVGVNEISTDSNGKKWYADVQGVIYHDDNSTPMDKKDDIMMFFGDASGITSPVQSIGFQSSSKRWYGTANGVYYHDDNGTILDKSDDIIFQYTTSNSKLPDNMVTKVLVDSNGNKWYATGKGIAYHNDNGTPTNPSDDTWVIYRDIDGLLSLMNSDMIKDPFNQRNWYAGFGGLSFHGGSLTPLDKSDDIWYGFKPPEDEIASFFLNKIFIDPGNYAQWVGTSAGISYHTSHFSNISLTSYDYTIKINWSVKSDSLFPSSVSSVRIYRSLSLNGDYELVREDSCLRSSCSWTDSDFLSGQTHYYWLSVVLSDGKEYRDKLDKIWGRPLKQVMPRFYFYSVDPPRSGSVGSYVDYPLYVIPVDGFNSPVTFSLKAGYSLPSGLTAVFIPTTRSCEGISPCSYMPSIFRVYINYYPTSCDLGVGARCVIELQAVGGSQTKYEKVLLNVRNPSTPGQSFITHFFYPDPDAEVIEVQESVEVRGSVYPPCGNAVVTSKFTPPQGRGAPVSVTGVTDDLGWFSIKYRPSYAGVWNVLTSWGGGCGLSGADTSAQPPLSPPDLPVSKAHTSINISTNANENTQPGDTITINVKIGPNPGAVPVFVRVYDPSGSILLSSSFTTSTNGEVSFGAKAVSGYMKVTAEWSGNADYHGTSSELIIPVAVPIGIGIIVEGRAVASVPQSAIDNLIKLAYKTLRNRNISDSRIYLLYTGNIDADGDGDYDQDGDSTKANLQTAIQTWASSMVSIGNPPSGCDTYAPYRTPLTIYLIGYGSSSGGSDIFYTANSDPVYESNLNTYLSNLYTNISSRYSSECNPYISPPSSYPVNVVMDFKYSGGFIPTIKGTDRILLSSVNASGQSPHFDNNGNVSYSAYFFADIDAGKYIYTSHADAVNILLNKVSNQNPMIDADWDGIANEVNDELQASQERLEYRSGPNMPPIVKGVKGSATLVQDVSPPPTSMDLWCVVEDKEDSSNQLSVKALIIPPANSYESPGIVTLYPSSPTFTGSYSGFYGGGTYTVMYMASDSYGNSAVVKASYVVVDDRVSPENVASVSVSYQGNGNFYVSWPPSTSKDTQGYILYVTKDDEYYDQVDVGNVVNYTYHVNGPGTYIFTVKSYDRVPNTASGTSSEPQYTPSDLVYFHASREGSNLYLFWEVSDKRGVIGYDILGGDRPDDIRRLNAAMIPFTGGVERVELNGISEDIKFIYVYIYYEDGSVVVAGAFDIFDSVIEVWDRGEDVEREKAKGRYIIVANYKFWDALDGYVSYRRQQGFDVEVVSQSYSFGGDYDYLFLISEEWTSEPYIMNEGKNTGILLVKSDDELRDYLNRVMEYEGERSRWLRSYYRDGVIYYEYNGRYRLGVAKEGDFKWDVLRGDDKFIGYVLTDSDDELEDVDLLIMKGDVNLGELGKLTVGDPALFIGSSEVSADTSFGCEQMSKKRTSLIYLFILISLISLPIFLMKLKKAEKM